VYDDAGSVRTLKLVRLGNPHEDAPSFIHKMSLERQSDEIVKASDLWSQYLSVCELIEKLYAEIKDLESGAGANSASSSHHGSSTSKRERGHHDKSKDKDKGGHDSDGVLSKDARDTIGRLRVAVGSRRTERREILAEIDQYRLTVQASLLNSADVVAGTLSSRFPRFKRFIGPSLVEFVVGFGGCLCSGQQAFIDHILRSNQRFDTAIIDEAGQASEPSTLIPLRYGCKRLILVGDPRQLPGKTDLCICLPS
jgi:hypothetical protein